MNRRQREAKLERARAHQTASAVKKVQEELQVASVPPRRSRRRTLSKKVVRMMGRKVRSDG